MSWGEQTISALPVVDATAVVKDPADTTKLMRIDVGAVATATTRVVTMPDQDIDLTPGTGSFATEAYTPAIGDDWEDADPTTKTEALDRIAGGHAGVALVSATAPTTPGIGQIWLDTAAAGASGLGTLNFVTITEDLVLTSSHTVVFCDASAGPIVVTVPVASGNGRKLYAIVKTDSTANTVTMDGGFDAVLTCQDEAVPILSDGTNWRIPF